MLNNHRTLKIPTGNRSLHQKYVEFLETHPSTCLRNSFILNLCLPVALILSVVIPASDSSFMEKISAVVPMAANNWLWLLPYLENKTEM